MKRKILIVTMSLYNGGAERSLVNFLNELPENKYEVDLLLFKREGAYLKQVPSYVNILQTPCNIVKLFSSFRQAGKFLMIKFFGSLLSRCLYGHTHKAGGFRWKYFYSKHIDVLTEKYDVAIAYFSGEIDYFVDEKVQADKKIVWVHNDYKASGHSREYDYPHFQNMDAIVTISEKCADILKEVFPEFTDKIYNIPNITSSLVLRRRAEEFYPQEYQRSKKRYKLLSVGRLAEQKGFDMAVSAAALLKKAGVSFDWFIIGNGPLEKQLERQMKKEGVEDCFKLIGVRENPYPYMKNCDLVVQSSRYEGKSVVLDEAKILAKPIVATDYPTVKDQIIDGEEGIITKMNPQGIAEGIEKLLRDRELSAHIQKSLSEHEYGNQQDVEKYIDLIEKQGKEK